MAAFNARNSASASASSSSTQTTFVPIPKLLESERTLLQENGGCYKCRKFYAGHIGPRCPNPPINGATYKTLTAADVPARPAGYASRSASSSSGRVAAVLNPPVEEELINFTEGKIETIAAVLPHAVSAVVDTGSPDYSDDECAPFSCSNLFWSCHLSAPSRSHLPAVTVKGLIDDGSSVVLIKESLVTRLKLPTFKAADPFVCQAAFSGSQDSLSLSSYVKIQPVSLDGRFSSRPLRAFVSPSLVTDLILGLPFLNSNSLLVDHGRNSCIVKLDNQSSYDLLHPSAPVPSTPVPLWKSSHVCASEVRAARRRARPAVRDVLLGAEMASRLRPRLDAHPARGQRGSRSSNIVAAVRATSRWLTAQA
ncbi:hypothetical protein EYR38_005279 [Pleurotus pulmonarius]|nr:hypothetical protein EYR38_005279 [Pleurotus pulmonarius]